MNKNPDKFVFICALVATILGIVFMIWVFVQIMTVRDEVERVTAQQYDLDCLTQPIEKPLTDCKESN